MVVFGLAAPWPAPAADDGVTVSPALSMYGDLKYPPGFKHFDYVNPDAPKGGNVKLAVIGTFDSLNPFILKGVPRQRASSSMFDTLLAPSTDEPFSEYGLIAESNRAAGRPLLGDLQPAPAGALP